MTNKEILKKWKGNQRYTLKIVAAMPEADYDFKPIDTVKSFKSQVSHITSWLRTHSKNVTENDLGKLKAKTKDELITELSNFFDGFITYLETGKENDLQTEVDIWYGKSSKAKIINAMDNHLAHHRGQMIVYLRLKEIKPPTYIGW